VYLFGYSQRAWGGIVGLVPVEVRGRNAHDRSGAERLNRLDARAGPPAFESVHSIGKLPGVRLPRAVDRNIDSARGKPAGLPPAPYRVTHPGDLQVKPDIVHPQNVNAGRNSDGVHRSGPDFPVFRRPPQNAPDESFP